MPRHHLQRPASPRRPRTRPLPTPQEGRTASSEPLPSFPNPTQTPLDDNLNDYAEDTTSGRTPEIQPPARELEALPSTSQRPSQYKFVFTPGEVDDTEESRTSVPLTQSSDIPKKVDDMSVPPSAVVQLDLQKSDSSGVNARKITVAVAALIGALVALAFLWPG